LIVLGNKVKVFLLNSLKRDWLSCSHRAFSLFLQKDLAVCLSLCVWAAKFDGNVEKEFSTVTISDGRMCWLKFLPSRRKFLGDKGKSWKLFEMLFKWRMGEIEMEYADLSRTYLK